MTNHMPIGFIEVKDLVPLKTETSNEKTNIIKCLIQKLLLIFHRLYIQQELMIFRFQFSYPIYSPIHC